ncbi:MAG: AraC family transcriptional regulator [Clostridia bacterium]|nr:AraC family transcriptional regulator [Clostridia bacterium]
MTNYHYEKSWPKDGLSVSCFVHELMNYRYHWHSDSYELILLLTGELEFVRGDKIYYLDAGDLVITGPLVGHSSFALQPHSQALVVQFSAKSFAQFLKKDTLFDFPDCVSCKENRQDKKYRLIRRYASQLYLAGTGNSPYGDLMVKGCLEMLIATLCEYCSPVLISHQEENESQRKLTESLVTYINEHYNEKVTLQDLADYCQYNRTYISTLFKNVIGVNFHEYLTKTRFEKALFQLTVTDKTLTAIAIDNGFTDLKTFNRLFQDILHRSPAKYREQLLTHGFSDRTTLITYGKTRRYLSAEDPELRRKLEEYI